MGEGTFSLFFHDSSDEMQSECEMHYFWIMNDME
jgi:hypothetical protein